MAREYARIMLTIWNDPNFQSQTADAQWLYFALVTHPKLTAAGVTDWREARLVKSAGDMTIPRLRMAAWELAQANLIAVDAETEEVLVRSFVRHDGVLKSPNMTKGLVREHAAIASLTLKQMVSHEVRRAVAENPEWRGAEYVTPITKQFVEPDGNPSRNPSKVVPDWFRIGSDGVTPKTGEPFRFGSPIPQPSTLNPSSIEEEGDGAAAATPTTRKNSARGTRIPEPFPITPEMVAWAQEHTPGINGREVTERFVDYWRAAPGQKGVKLDWVATWRNWLRREHDQRQGPTPRPPSHPTLDPTSPEYDPNIAAVLARQ